MYLRVYTHVHIHTHTHTYTDTDSLASSDEATNYTWSTVQARGERLGIEQPEEEGPEQRTFPILAMVNGLKAKGDPLISPLVNSPYGVCTCIIMYMYMYIHVGSKHPCTCIKYTHQKF